MIFYVSSSKWKLQQENISKPFSYVFPQMPPQFRRCCFAKALFLMEWSCTWMLALGVIVAIAVALFRGKDALLEGGMALLTVLVFFVLLPLGFLCRWLRNTPKFFWRCPCCGQPFPYYAPPLLQRGITVKESRGRLSYLTPDRAKPITAWKLGDDFDRAAVGAVLERNAARPNREPRSTKFSVREQLHQPKGVQRMVYIEANKAQGKGLGYENWAKTFNLEAVPIDKVCAFASKKCCRQGKKPQEYFVYCKIF